ncbi:MAG TPA: flagellar biosynthetic protein FliO [Burkholderiaceae bacterium]
MIRRPPSKSRTLRSAFGASSLLVTAAAWAESQAPAPASGPSLTPLLVGLLFVLALIPAAAWLMRRAGLGQPAAASGLRVVAQLPLGPRDRVVIIEVADRRWLLGVSAAGIQRLGTLPPGDESGTPPPAASQGGFSDIVRRLVSSR